MTGAQIETVFAILSAIGQDERPHEFHQGDCLGSDAQAFNLSRAAQFVTVSHPPLDPVYRAWTPATHVYHPRPYLERNRVIVDMTETLLAAPHAAVEEIRSGTWSTVRYARRWGKGVTIVSPDGSVLGPLSVFIPAPLVAATAT